MLTVTVELLHGTYRADPDGLAVTGEQVLGEWPPAPARLFSAFVAADGTRDRCRVTDGRELAFLEGCAPPVIHADGPGQVHHQPLRTRFVVRDDGGAVKGSAHLEYQARGGVGIRPGVRVSPRHPKVTFVWQETPDDVVLHGLVRRAARIGYLGCADSPVHVTVGDRVPPAAPEHRYEPSAVGGLALGVVVPGMLDALDAHYDQWVEHGPSVTRQQSRGLRRLAAYRSSDDPIPEDEPARPTMLVYRLDAPVSGRRVVSLVDAFKGLVLARYHDVNGHEPPALLHGHLPKGDSGPRASFLALPNVGGEHADGVIHALAVVLPPDTEPRHVEGVRSALQPSGPRQELPTLTAPGITRRLRAHAGEPKPNTARPGRWLHARGRRWVTAFPALHERRGVPVDLEQVSVWCSRAGLPAPVAVRSSRHPLAPGAVDLRPHEINRKGRPNMPYGHVELIFGEEVTGIVCIGSGRHLGLGLCVPVAEVTDGETTGGGGHHDR